MKYGSAYVAKQLGYGSTYDLFESAMSNDCPAVCRQCGDIQESGCEPDADGYDCEACGAQGTVYSVLVIAGLI